MRTGELGFWWRSLGGAETTRPALEGPAEADVAIVGAGYTGLWTAYYLKRADPALRIVVLERELAGYGASGRNGGWVSGFFSGPAHAYERHAEPAALHALRREMFATVGEIGRVLAEEGIEADFVQDGQIELALDAAQEMRQRESLATARERGLAGEDLRALSRAELAEHLHVPSARAASSTPHVARVHPAKLLRGLAAATERLGVVIYERTPVREIRPHTALTPAGPVRARWVLRATEGYTAGLPGLRRLLVPMNSSMIVTEPLTASLWREIGWRGAEVLSDAAHVYVYLQRTADGRIAIGGRGSPYRFGSRTDRVGETPLRTVRSLRQRLVAMFPTLHDARIDHAWSGVLGVPRDWAVAVRIDRASGLAEAGGYVGEGVAAANLAGRILRDLMLEHDTELTRLAWVGRPARLWEPEPLRWVGIHGMYGLYRRADALEHRSGRPSRLGELLDRASGRR